MIMITITDKDFVVQIGNYKFYRCKCKKNDIKIKYNFCPYCGQELEFDLKEDK